MKIFRLIFSIIIVPVLIFGGNPSSVRSMPLAAAAVLIRVPSDVATLQAAVSAVSDGGIIEMAAGTYMAPAGGWIFNNLGKSFTVQAASGATVKLSGGGTSIVLRMQNVPASAGKPIIFKNLIFENGYSQTEGLAGGVTLYSSTVTFLDCTFQNNTANITTTVGGGIYVADNSQVFFINTLWQGNIAQNGGAGLGVRSNSKIYIHNSRFVGNLANFPNHRPYSSGGGINLGNSTLRLSNTVFENNKAAGFGAGLYIIGNWVAPYTTPQSDVIVANSLFLNNEAKPDATVSQAFPTEGGGINMEDQSLLKIYNTRFIKNRAMIGGGLNLFRSTAEVYNSVFLGNQADGPIYTASFGGSISISSTDDAVLDGFNNRPTAKITVEDSWIQGHYDDVTTAGSQSGGCLSAIGDNLRMDGDPGVPDIGSIAENRAIVSINRVVFNDCDALAVSPNSAAGGAIKVAIADLNIQNSLVMRSDALGPGFGGGLAALWSSNVNISDTTFAYDMAGSLGGGLFIQGSTIQVNNSNFYGNEVPSGSNYGAAIFTSVDDARNLPVNGTIQNSVFSNNTGFPMIFDDDRDNGPINDVHFNNNQFYDSGGVNAYIYKNPIYSPSVPIGTINSASQLNDRVISRSNGTSTDKGSGNTGLSSAPKLGEILAAPLQILTTNAAGETPAPPTLGYLGYAWNGSSATLDGYAVTGNTGASSAGTGTHTLSVGGSNFTAAISQAPTPAAAFTSSGNSPSTLNWSVTGGTFLDAAIDHDVTISSASGSVQVSPPVDTDYLLYVITKEGGLVEFVETGIPILNVPSVIVLAGSNYSINKGYIPIKNDGGGTLQWTATSQTPSLITMDTPTGETDTVGTITIDLNVGSLTPGDYVGTVNVDAGAAGTELVTVYVKYIGILNKIYLPFTSH